MHHVDDRRTSSKQNSGTCAVPAVCGSTILAIVRSGAAAVSVKSLYADLLSIEAGSCDTDLLNGIKTLIFHAFSDHNRKKIIGIYSKRFVKIGKEEQ
jgi:hypothetical protein